MGYTAPKAAIHPAYQRFGDNAARAVLSSIATLPPAMQASGLKRALTKIDPSLYTRTQEISARFRAQGMPASRALQKGLSRAMATGMLAEVVKTGQRGKVAKKGLMGLGCYGCVAAVGGLGALTAGTGILTKAISSDTKVAAATTVVPAPGVCTPDGAFIYYTAADGSLALKRRTATDVCVGTGGAAPTVRDASTTGGGVTVTDTPTGIGDGKGPYQVIWDIPANDAASSDPDAAHKILQVGPFQIPLGAKQYTITWQGLLPSDWIAFITQELAHDCSNCIRSSMIDATPGHTYGTLRDFLGPATPSRVNQDLVSFGQAQPDAFNQSKVYYKISLPDQPIALVTRPDTGEDWGMFAVVAPKDPSYPWDSTTNPYVLRILWRKKPTGVWDWIKHIVGVVIDAVGDALQKVGELACDLLNSQAGQVGAVAGGAAIGAEQGGAKGAQVGAQIGQAGAQIGAAQCSGSTAPVVTVKTNWLVPVAVFGVGAALIYAFNKRKKKAATP